MMYRAIRNYWEIKVDCKLLFQNLLKRYSPMVKLFRKMDNILLNNIYSDLYLLITKNFSPDRLVDLNDYKRKEKHITNLERTVEIKTSANEKLVMDNNILNQKVNELLNESQIITSKYNDTQKKLDDTQKKLDDTQKRLEEIVNSKGYKLLEKFYKLENKFKKNNCKRMKNDK